MAIPRSSTGKSSLTVRYAELAAADATKNTPHQRAVCERRGQARPAAKRAPVIGEQDPRRRVRERDHRPSPDRVEEPRQHDRPEEVAHGERQEIEPDVVRAHAVEAAEDQRVREEDRVVRERLRRHERQAEDRPAPVLHEEDVRDLAERDRAVRPHAHRRARERAAGPFRSRHVGLDGGDDVLGLVDAPVEQEPARALGQVPAHEQHERRRERRRGTKARRQPRNVGTRRGSSRKIVDAAPSAVPIQYVLLIDEVHATAHVRGHQLVDRRVDRRALPADSRARDGAPEGEADEAPTRGPS